MNTIYNQYFEYNEYHGDVEHEYFSTSNLLPELEVPDIQELLITQSINYKNTNQKANGGFYDE